MFVQNSKSIKNVRVRGPDNPILVFVEKTHMLLKLTIWIMWVPSRSWRIFSRVLRGDHNKCVGEAVGKPTSSKIDDHQWCHLDMRSCLVWRQQTTRTSSIYVYITISYNSFEKSYAAFFPLISKSWTSKTRSAWGGMRPPAAPPAPYPLKKRREKKRTH